MITRPFSNPIQRRIALTLLTLAGALATTAVVLVKAPTDKS